MHDHVKEQLLHKFIASSAFVCALCILPVAQYFLVTSQLPEGGQVAGVSNDKSIIQADIPAASTCQDDKTKQLADLDRFQTGEKQALLRTYETNTKPYKDGIAALVGTPESIQQETAALKKLIDAEYSTYLKKLSAVESAVASQKKDIDSRSCVAE